MTRTDDVNFVVRVPKRLLRAVKVAAVEQECRMRDIVADALIAALKKSGKADD